MIVERRMRGFFSDFDYAVEELNHGWRWVGGGSEKRIGGKFYEWVLEGGGGGRDMIKIQFWVRFHLPKERSKR